MLFNSFEYPLFVGIVFFLFWFVTNKNLTLQNLLLVIASFIYYGWWNRNFVFLIAFSCLVNYLIGLSFLKCDRRDRRKLALTVGIFINLGFLFFFKYYIYSAKTFNIFSLVVPLGISFNTFQALGYLIDVYRKKIKPCVNIITFSAFLIFFPKLVAGPIEQSTIFLPQFNKARKFDYQKAVDGMRQILWGLFKKVIIADICAQYVNSIFNNYTGHTGSTLFLGAILFTFQIYGDFSGYSDIAIGSARLFGFDLMRNFAFPYFSRNIAEFWRKWHISLMTWFKDYVYIPLGGNRGSKLFKMRNLFIVFLLSGLWHGLNWTFITWSILNFVYYLPLLTIKSTENNNKIKEFLQIISTFLLTTFAWIFFRSGSMPQAFGYVARIFSPSLFSLPTIRPMKLIIIIMIFIVVEWVQRNKQHALQINSHKIPMVIRWGIYYIILLIIFIFGGAQTDYIYFKF